MTVVSGYMHSVFQVIEEFMSTFLVNAELMNCLLIVIVQVQSLYCEEHTYMGL